MLVAIVNICDVLSGVKNMPNGEPSHYPSDVVSDVASDVAGDVAHSYWRAQYHSAT